MAYTKIKIEGTIEVLTGLHIGGDDSFSAIGTIDSPVVRDPLLGCNPHPDEFADTAQHPLRPGALRATRSIGSALVSGDFWNEELLLERSRFLLP